MDDYGVLTSKVDWMRDINEHSITSHPSSPGRCVADSQPQRMTMWTYPLNGSVWIITRNCRVTGVIEIFQGFSSACIPAVGESTPFWLIEMPNSENLDGTWDKLDIPSPEVWMVGYVFFSPRLGKNHIFKYSVYIYIYLFYLFTYQCIFRWYWIDIPCTSR